MPKHRDATLDYIRSTFAPQDELLARIDRTLHENNIAIHIGAEEGKILQWLIRLHGATRIVEVGTLAGYSTIWMARALPAGGQIYTINKEARDIALAKKFFAESDVATRITMLEGDANKLLPDLALKGPFDMIFIDADKISYNNYLDWAEKNIRKGGLIIADNTLLFGSMGMDKPPEDIAPATWKAMRQFNERLSDKNKYDAMMLPTQDGMTVALKLTA